MSVCVCVCMRVHVCGIIECYDARSHTQSQHAHVHTHTLTLTHTHTPAHTHTHTHIHPITRNHTRSHTHARPHTNTSQGHQPHPRFLSQLRAIITERLPGLTDPSAAVALLLGLSSMGLPLHGPGDVLEVVQGMLVGSPRRECVCVRV